MGKKRKRSRPRLEVTFDSACELVETILQGTTRREILTGISSANSFHKALLRLREGMRTNRFTVGGDQISLERVVNRLDKRSREEGFHVLHDWDGVAAKLNEETIPVDVLNYMIGRDIAEASRRTVLAVLLDYYFLYVLALFSMRAWDEGDKNENLDRVTRLLDDLQGPKGSGQKFAEDAETLILIATSHFEYDEQAYERLLDKIKVLNQAHRTRAALAHAPILGCHLRFGFETTYRRDIVKMRDDNIADYPWLCFALATLMADYARMHDEGFQGTERECVVEGLLNGLSPDARAFVGKPPAFLSAYEAERAEFGELFQQYSQVLVEEFEQHRPSDQRYSAMSFYFNFAHNLLKAMVVDALLRGEAWDLTLNDLLTGIRHAEARNESRVKLAETLMGYARRNPDTIRGRPTPVIVYDPRSGLRAFTNTVKKIEEKPPEAKAAP